MSASSCNGIMVMHDVSMELYFIPQCSASFTAFDFVVLRYAVSSVKAACDRRRENNHSEPDRPAKVPSLFILKTFTKIIIAADKIFTYFFFSGYILQKGPREGRV